MPLKKPRLLIVTTEANPATDRLIQALNEIGFELALVNGGSHPPRQAEILLDVIPAGPWRFRTAVERAIQRVMPDMIVPMDKWATRQLRQIHEYHAAGIGPAFTHITRTIENSLGDSYSYQLTANPLALARFNRQHKVSAPSSVEVTDETALRAVLQSVPLPVILKSGDAWDGCDVALVRDVDAGIAAYRRMTGNVGLLKRLVAAGQAGRWPSLFRPVRCDVLLEQYIDGIAVNAALVCRNGRVLAGFNVDGSGAGGRFVVNPTLDRVASLIVRTLKLSGFVAFQFMLEHRTGGVFLIGMNQHSTQICHLVTPDKIDLLAALYRSFVGTGGRNRESIEDNVVALFARARAHTPDFDQAVDVGSSEEYAAPLNKYIMSPGEVTARTRKRTRGIGGHLAHIVRKL